MQGRNPDLNDIEPIEEVFAEPPFLDRLLQIPVGGSDDADIRLSGGVISDPFIFFVLEKTQEFWLQVRRQVSNLVQEKRPSFTGCNATGIIPNRTRKGSLHMPEQFALKEFRRKRRA